MYLRKKEGRGGGRQGREGLEDLVLFLNQRNARLCYIEIYHNNILLYSYT